LDGGYHDAVTFNDTAYLNTLGLLRDISLGTNDFTFFTDAKRAEAERAFQKGLQCLLQAQVPVNGRRTIWPQQADALTLKPTAARNYEMPSLAASESANILLFLLRLPEPSADVAASIRDAAAWFEKTAIRDHAFRSTGPNGRFLVPEPGHGPIWARYYEMGTDRPLFGDRDRTIHDRVDEISKERRAGYSWYGDGARRALQHYERWEKAQARKEKASKS
jgi:PelA/Pel-15E family pectate lyase